MNEHFCSSTTSSTAKVYSSSQMSDVKGCSIRLKCSVILLLSGNAETNPGPDTLAHCDTPADFKSGTDLGVIHYKCKESSKQDGLDKCLDKLNKC